MKGGVSQSGGGEGCGAKNRVEWVAFWGEMGSPAGGISGGGEREEDVGSLAEGWGRDGKGTPTGIPSERSGQRRRGRGVRGARGDEADWVSGLCLGLWV